MAVEVRATPLTNKIIENLPRRSRRVYDQFEADLAARGCAALTYRLSGNTLDHLCVRPGSRAAAPCRASSHHFVRQGLADRRVQLDAEPQRRATTFASRGGSFGVRGAETIPSRIHDLDLGGTRFDARF